MTEFSSEEEGDLLAAEYALGLLDGSDLARAQRLMLSDRSFVEAVELWSTRLAPLTDEILPVQPDEGIWTRIEQSLAELDEGSTKQTGSNLVVLRRQLRLWRNIAVGASAMAASLALFITTRGIVEQPVPVQATRSVLLASLSSESSGASLSVAYDRQSNTLLVTPGVLRDVAGREHELWVIPAGGKPVSIGLVRPGAPQRLSVPLRLASEFRDRSTIAVSVEPVGGSRTGQPTGPVIAAGELSTI